MLRTERNALCAGATAIWLAASVAGCVSSVIPDTEPGQIAAYDRYDISADSADLRGGVTLRVLNDSILQVATPTHTLDISPGEPLEGRFGYTSDQPLIDLLYRLESATPLPYTYTPATPYEAYLLPFPTDSLSDLLMMHESGGVLLPTETRRYSWPIINDNAPWLMAAAEVCTASGENGPYRRLRSMARNLASIDYDISWNPAIGLFQGVPRYMATSQSGLPPWMESADLLQCITLCGNTARYATARTMAELDHFHGYSATEYLPVSADSLRRNINTLMWLPNMGYYSAMLYGSAVYPIQLISADNLAQSVAILSGTASEAMAATAVRRIPVPPTGIEPFTPLWASDAPYSGPSATLLQALWTAACARSGNETAYSAAVGALLYRRCSELAAAENPRIPQGRPITALIVRGLLGMKFECGGASFSPFVPESLPGEKQITGLRYRDAVLDIKISGTGRAVSTFTIDSIPSQPHIPADLKGRHDITITLGGASANRGIANISDSAPIMPPAPDIVWKTDREATLSAYPPTNSHSGTDYGEKEDAGTFLIYINGTLVEEIYRHEYTLYNAPALTMVQLCPVNADHITGFSARPYRYVPPRQQIIIPASSVAKGGTRLIKDKASSKKFVELNKFHNRIFSFDADVPSDGLYLVDVRYVNGLGIVNPQRRATLRELYAGNQRIGTFVFPQLSSAAWNKDLGEGWQQTTTYTNPVTARLRKGRNQLSIRFTQPSPVYIDPAHNTVLIDAIRIIPLKAT